VGETTVQNTERFRNVLLRKPVDRLPMIEWAPWWEKTTDRWYAQGLPKDVQGTVAIQRYFGLDAFAQVRIAGKTGDDNEAIRSVEEYESLDILFPEPFFDEDRIKELAWLHEKGEVIIWVSMDGYFWFPRTLFGIEQHLYAFFDHPELMHRMNEELVQYQMRFIDALTEHLTPDILTFAEDMSYNSGPMISKRHFDTFIAPYYTKMLPYLKEKGIPAFMDSDGDVSRLIPWLEEIGIQGIIPLERQAGVDVNDIRINHPDLLMMGGFDKTVIHQGEHSIRNEFDRLMPTMRKGGFIPSVDHQTPPDVTLDMYRTYVQLLKEYCEKAPYE